MWMMIYPWSPYSGGADTKDYQYLSNTITHYGSLIHVMHPISLWGQYPFSMPAGAPVFLSAATQLTGIHVIQNVIILDYILGMFLLLTSICLFMKIKKNFLFVFGGALIITLSPRFIAYLTGLFEARGFIALMFPFWLLLLIFAYKNNLKKKYLTLVIFTFIIISTIHLNFLFFTPVIISIIFIKLKESGLSIPKVRKLINRIRSKNRTVYRISSHRISKWFFWFFLILLFSVLLIYIGERGWVETIRYDPSRFEEGGFISGYGILGTIISIAISMSGGAGFGFFILGVIGFFVALSIPRKSSIEILFLYSFILSIPFMATAVYFRPFFVIYAAFFSGYGLYWLGKKRFFTKKSIASIFMIFLIVSTCLFSSFMVSRWAENISAGIIQRQRPEAEVTKMDYYTGEQVFQTGVYLRYNHDTDERFADYRKPLDQERLEIISGAPRYGNPYSIDEIESVIRQDLWGIIETGQLHDPYGIDPPMWRIYPRFFAGDFDRIEELATDRNVTIVYTSPPNESSDQYMEYLIENRYIFYENDKDALWGF